MRTALALAAGLVALAALGLFAQNKPAPGWRADVDHLVLALSWSPSWCATAAPAGHPQCAPERGVGWMVHGLWPQTATGWNDWCDGPDLTTGAVQQLAGPMETEGLARYQWDKHGTCTGLSPTDYADRVDAAFTSIAPPRLPRETTAVGVIAAFREANGLPPGGLSVSCDEGHLRDVRICLSLDLEPIACPFVKARPCPGALAVPPPG
ncbi:MAG: ribonuclease T [Pseudomonadota bacterium]